MWSAWSGRSGTDGVDDPDERWLTAVLHIAFFLLLGASLVRYLIRDTGTPPNGWVVALFVAFGALYLPGRWPAPAPSPDGRPPAAIWPG